MPDLWSYWKKSGIDRAYATKVAVWSHSQGSVQNGVLHFGSMIAELVVSKTSALSNHFGVYGGILLTVDGFDPEGPLVVFETKTTQLTWAQWNSSVYGVWGVSTSWKAPTPPPTTTTTVVPPTTTTLPPTTTTTVVQNVSVTFDANGGLGFMSNEVEPLGSVVALSLNGFVYSGYAFAGWNTSPSGGGTSYSNGATFSFTTNVTLYAQWTAASTTTTFPGLTSTNWSGYVLPTSTIVTDVSGEWTVPTLNCTDTPNGDSSTWVGTGGTQGTSLLQTGVNDNCVNGVQVDSGWWELVPATPNHEEIFSNFPVSPGNTIEASVFEQSDGAWATEVADLNTGLTGFMITGQSWGVGVTTATSYSVQGNTTGLSYSGAYSAEWIEEDVTSANSGSLIAFPNYGSVTFFNLRTNLSSWSLPNSDGREITNSSNVPVSVPGPINSSGGFTVNYTGP